MLMSSRRTAVDDATHVLGHEGLVADDHALGQGFRAAGVGHLAGVFDVQDGVRLRGGVGFIPGLEILETVVTGGLLRPLSSDQIRSLRSAFVQDVLDQIEQGIFDDEDLALGMVDAIGDVLSPQKIVDGQIDGADLAAAEPGQDVVDRVVGQNGDPVVFLNAEVHEGVGHPVALGLQFRVSERSVL